MKRFLAYLISLTFLCTTGYAAAVIFSGNNVKALKSNMDLNGTVTVQSGGVRPDLTSTTGNSGSLYLNTGGSTFTKTDAGASTNWKLLLQSPFTTLGDQAYWNGTGLTKVGIGSGNSVWTVSAGVPAWKAEQGLVSPLTTTGDMIYSNPGSTAVRLGIGSGGSVLTVNASTGLPQWNSGLALNSTFFASSQITTNSAGITSTSFATFSNSPAFTFTPTITGTYKVYAIASYQVNGTITHEAQVRVFNTTGGATLLYEAQGAINSSLGSMGQMCQSVYTLTAGTTYVFDIQGLVDNAAENILLDGRTGAGSGAPGYMFAELYSPLNSTSNSANTPIYSTGYFDNSASWNNSSGTQADWTVAAAGNFVTLSSNGLTVTRAASNLPGITFTPSAAGNVYLVYANPGGYNLLANTSVNYFLTDGTTNFAQCALRQAGSATAGAHCPLQGLYTSSGTTAVTLKIQGDVSGSTGEILSVGAENAIDWTIQQISAPATSGATVTSVSSNTSASQGVTYLADTTGGSFNLTLPVPKTGAVVTVKDKTGKFGTNKLTVVRNGSEKIDGLAASRVLVGNSTAQSFVSDGTDWYMLNFPEEVSYRAHSTTSPLTSALGTIQFTTEDEDTANICANGICTVNKAGLYHVEAALLPTASTVAVSTTVSINILKNGVVWSQKDLWPYTAAASKPASVDISDDVRMASGDSVCIQASSNGTTPSITNTATKNWFLLRRVGN